MPSAGSKSADIRNCSRWPNHPQIGWRRRVCNALAHIHEGWRAGAAVQILVAAADGEVGAARCNGTRTEPAEWLTSHRIKGAGRVREPRDLGHVQQRARAVSDVREADQRRVLI